MMWQIPVWLGIAFIALILIGGIGMELTLHSPKLIPLLLLALLIVVLLVLGYAGYSGLWTEAAVVGVVFVAMGYLASWVVMLGTLVLTDKPELPEECKKWNSNWSMEWSLFLAGIFGHFLFEAMGANKWYCTNGVACKI